MMSHHTRTRTRTIRASCLLLAALQCLLLLQLELQVQAQGASGAANQSQAGLQPQQASAGQLQQQLNQIQQQAQRQLGQLNGLVLNAANSSTKYSSVFEAISNVGKAIHQQISAAAANTNNVNIMTQGQGAPMGAVNPLAASELANNKKNEYQSIVTTDQGSFLQQAGGGGSVQPVNGTTNANYREQGEFLRQEIMRRAGQLQQVVASSMDLLKNNGDLIVRRLLEQMNVRLDQAKAKADKILMNEPAANNEVAVKALATINMGLNNLNNIISNIVVRMDLANKQDQQQQQLQLQGPNSIQQRLQAAIGQPVSASLAGQVPPLLDANRLRSNLHQLSQQFHQALNGSQLHQQLSLIRQQRLQQMSLVGGPQNQQTVQQQEANSKPIKSDISTAVRQ